MHALVTKMLYDTVTYSPEETIAFGRTLARDLHPPCVVSLEGDLGSGKTTLAKGVVAALGAAREEEVTSPTFTLVHEYAPCEAGPGADGSANRVFHVDLYRVDGAREAESLGLDELFDARSIVLIEWGEKLSPVPPGPRVRVRLEALAEDTRRITVEVERRECQPP